MATGFPGGGISGQNVLGTGGYSPELPWWQAGGIQQPKLPQMQKASPQGYTYDPVKGGYVQTVGSAGDQLAQRERAQKQQELLMQQQQALFQRAMSGLSGGGMQQMPSLANLPQMQPMPQMPTMPSIPRIGNVSAPDTSAAEEAAFGRAKDQQGKITRSALTGLQSSLAGRGMLGSGQEGRRTREIVQGGAEALSNLTREQAIQHADNAQKMAELAYTGGITQRGQDIGAQRGQQEAALEGWRAQNQSALQQGQFGLEAWKAQNDAALARQQMQMQQQNQLNQALSGLTQSFSRLY